MGAPRRSVPCTSYSVLTTEGSRISVRRAALLTRFAYYGR